MPDFILTLRSKFIPVIHFLGMVLMMYAGTAQENQVSLTSQQTDAISLADSAQQLYKAGKFLECQSLTSKMMTICHNDRLKPDPVCLKIALLHTKASVEIYERDKEFEMGRQQLSLFIKEYGTQLEFIDKVKIQFKLSNLFYQEKNLFLARRAMDKCLELINEYNSEGNLNSDENEIINNLNYLILVGRTNRSAFDNFEGAIGVYEKVLLIYKMNKMDNDDLYVRIITELGYTYHLLRKYDKGLDYYNLAWEVVNDERYKGNFYKYLCSLTGKIHLHKRDFELALSYFEKGLTLSSKLKSADYPNYCNNLGFYYDSVKNYQKSIEYFTEALTYMESGGKKDNFDFSAQYLYLGRGYSKFGDYSTAISFYEKDVQTIKKYFGSNYYKLLYSYEGLGDTYCLIHKREANDSLLNIGLQFFQSSINLIQEFVGSSDDLLLKKKVLQNAHVIGTKYLQWIYQSKKGKEFDANQQREVWKVIEFLHNSLLMLNKLESDALYSGNVPDSLLIILNRLNLECNSLQLRIAEHQQLHSNSISDETILNLKSLQRIKADSVNWMRSLISDVYPGYNLYKDSLKTISIEEVQNLLTQEQTLLEYSCTDTLLFCFMIQRNKKKLFIVPLHQAMDEMVKQCNRGIYSYHLKQTSSAESYTTLLKEYTSSALKLYKVLLQPLSNDLTKELIIIPDSKFDNLSFDVLLSSNPSKLSNFSTFSFLIKKHTFHYNFSASLMKKMKETTNAFEAQNRLMALAPFYEKDPVKLKLGLKHPEAIRFGITELPYSGLEVNAIKGYFGGTTRVLLGDDASRNSFLQWAPKFQILHLATHGKANFEDGSLSFVAFKAKDKERRFDLIIGSDFQSIRLNAELVVLSACETAIGEFNMGNGTISLSSSIAASGAKSIVASLWKVNDHSTMQLMQNFYKELSRGKTKSESLRFAKINYLNASSPSNRHPFYWSGFNLYGDHSAIRIKE